MATTIQKQRQASPERWQRALERAIAGNVQVRQLGSTGQWIASSASDPTACYELAVTNGVVHECSCPAATFGNDPICCHRAAWWHLAGVLNFDPEPPTLAAPNVPLVYTGTFAGKHRTVTVVERTRQPGTFDIIDFERKQKIGGGGELGFILNRLQESGFVPVPATAAA